MYNNEVTYDKKWDTPENEEAKEVLENKYLDTWYSSHCPPGWAPEVLELLEYWDKEYGIAKTESIYSGGWKVSSWQRKIKCLWNKFHNWVFQPQILLTQIKEKYGCLVVSYSAPRYFDRTLDLDITKTEIRLARKGCYYPEKSVLSYKTTEYGTGKYYRVKKGELTHLIGLEAFDVLTKEEQVKKQEEERALKEEKAQEQEQALC